MQSQSAADLPIAGAEESTGNPGDGILGPQGWFNDLITIDSRSELVAIPPIEMSAPVSEFPPALMNLRLASQAVLDISRGPDSGGSIIFRAPDPPRVPLSFQSDEFLEDSPENVRRMQEQFDLHRSGPPGRARGRGRGVRGGGRIRGTHRRGRGAPPQGRQAPLSRWIRSGLSARDATLQDDLMNNGDLSSDI